MFYLIIHKKTNFLSQKVGPGGGGASIYIYIYIAVGQVMKLHPLDVGGKESLSVKTSQIQSYKLQDICMQIHIKLQ